MPLDMSACTGTAAWEGVTRSHADCLAHLSAQSSPCPLRGLIGFHLKQLVWDAMHADCLGLRLHGLGSTMLQMCREGVPFAPPATGDWKSKANSQLADLSRDFSHWLSENKRTCSQRRFNLNSIRMQTQKSWPELKAKAKNATLITEYLLSVHEQLEHRTELQNYRLLMLWGFDAMFRMFNNKQRWLTVEQRAQLESIRSTLLNSYHHVNLVSSYADEAAFAMKPKFHAIDELCRWASEGGLNPGSFWAFGSEDLCGRVGKIAAACHPASMNRRVLQRWILSFFSESRS